MRRRRKCCGNCGWRLEGPTVMEGLRNEELTKHVRREDRGRHTWSLFVGFDRGEERFTGTVGGLKGVA